MRRCGWTSWAVPLPGPQAWASRVHRTLQSPDIPWACQPGLGPLLGPPSPARGGCPSGQGPQGAGTPPEGDHQRDHRRLTSEWPCCDGEGGASAQGQREGFFSTERHSNRVLLVPWHRRTAGSALQPSRGEVGSAAVPWGQPTRCACSHRGSRPQRLPLCLGQGPGLGACSGIAGLEPQHPCNSGLCLSPWALRPGRTTAPGTSGAETEARRRTAEEVSLWCVHAGAFAKRQTGRERRAAGSGRRAWSCVPNLSPTPGTCPLCPQRKPQPHLRTCLAG